MRLAHHKTFDMKKFFSYFPIFLLGFGLLFSGCIDDKFDEPPIDGDDPDITTNATIADVLALWQPGNIVEITDDLVFDAVVISSDEAGNFYKALVVEDENSGIRFSINATGLYNDFAQFRHVYVKAKGLYIGDYRDLPTLGAGIGTNNQGNPIIERIPNDLVAEHIIKGKKNRPSPIREKTIAEVTLSDVNRLIRLTDVEFVAGDTLKTIAGATSAGNRKLTDCLDNTIDIRTSNYADFADAQVPSKHGTVDAVVGIYNGGLQLSLNYFEDIKMTEDRCTGGSTGGSCDTWTIIGTSTTGASVDEKFDGITNKQDLNEPGWLNATCVDGGRVWRGKTYQSTKYISSTAFGDNNPEVHTLAITPGVTNIGSKTLTFKSAQDHFTQDNLRVLISTDFDGSDIAGATWTELSATLAGSSNSNYEWVNSGNVSLAAYSGTGYIAFEYKGSGPGGNTGGFSIDDVKIQ